MGGSKVRKTEGVKYAGGPVLRKKGGGRFGRSKKGNSDATTDACFNVDRNNCLNLTYLDDYVTNILVSQCNNRISQL